MLVPIWRDRTGRIVDRRNRAIACEKLGIDCPSQIFQGSDAEVLHFIISANMRRRHLVESQRALAAAQLANFTHGGDRKSDQAANLPVVSQAAAAELFKVSERSVRSARFVLANANVDVLRAVEEGQLSVSRAAYMTRARPAQERLIAAGNRPASLPKLVRHKGRAIVLGAETEHGLPPEARRNCSRSATVAKDDARARRRSDTR